MELHFGPYTVEVSNPDKILFPEAGINKKALIDYYQLVSDHMLPLIEDRPVTMHRFPDGIGEDGFFQKEVSPYFPDWLDTVTVEKEKGKLQMVTLQNKASLAYLAHQACITPHIWLSKKDKPKQPDKIIFDLDPPNKDFSLVKEGAFAIKNLLEGDLDLKSFVMTSGSKGLHIVIPMVRSAKYDQVHEFSKGISELLAHQHPEKFTAEVRKEARNGRLFIDYLRNSYAQTAVAPYAVRALKDAPIACPITWHELENSISNAQAIKIKDVEKRVNETDNPWSAYRNTHNAFQQAQTKLKHLRNG